MSDFDFNDFHGGEHLSAGAEYIDDLHFDGGFAHHSDLPELAGGAEPEHYDLIGADPDEEGLWDQLMLDMNDGVNPYVGG